MSISGKHLEDLDEFETLSDAGVKSIILNLLSFIAADSEPTVQKVYTFYFVSFVELMLTELRTSETAISRLVVEASILHQCGPVLANSARSCLPPVVCVFQILSLL